MKSGHRYSGLVRACAAALALTVTAQGGEVPMCVSLLAKAAAPCAMHTRGAHSTYDGSGASITAAPSGHHACHADAASLSCAAGGSCPTGGTAAPVWTNVPIVSGAASRRVATGPSSAPISYLAPPLAPPPQA